MYWRLLPHVTCCVASDRLILLDVRQDRYFMIPELAAERALAWLDEPQGSEPPAAVAALLRSSGIYRPGDTPPETARHDIVGVRRDLPEGDRPASPATIGDGLRVALLVTACRVRLRRQPLARTLERQRSLNPNRRADRPEQGIERARTFDAVRRFTPFARNCLLDSLALDTWLARDRVDARLVFGVAAQPFAAHCWLQSGSALLNDHYDRVSRFTPILAL